MGAYAEACHEFAMFRPYSYRFAMREKSMSNLLIELGKNDLLLLLLDGLADPFLRRLISIAALIVSGCTLILAGMPFPG